MVHFTINGRLGAMGAMGWLGGMGAMGWLGGMGAMGWLGGCNYIDTSAFHFLVQSFLAGWKMGKYFFPFGATSVAQKSTFLFSDVTDWLRLWKWKSISFVPRLVANKGKQSTFPFFNMLNIFWMRKWDGVVSVWLHPPNQPIAPIAPSHPFMGEVGHGAAVAPRRPRK